MKGKLKNKQRKGLDALYSRPIRRSKKLKAFFLQGGKWQRVGQILG